ncbi:MAG: tetratricopeptide repeat protein [Bacteroidales bacterium]
MSSFKFTIVIALLFLFINPALSQTDRQIIDSLTNVLKTTPENKQIEILNELSRLYWNYSLDSSFYYANEALSLAHIVQDKLGLSDSYNRIGNVYYFQQQYEKSLEFFEKSLAARKTTNDQTGIANIYNNMANLYSETGNNEKALELYNLALTINISLNDKVNSASNYSSIALTYEKMENSRKALEYYFKSLELNKELGKEDALARAYSSIGNVYSEISSWDMALNYFLDALEIYKKTNNQSGLSAMYNNIGIIYQNIKENDKALLYFQKSLEIEINLNNEPGQSSAYNNIGTVYDTQGNNDKALEYYNKSHEINKKYNDPQGIAISLNNIGLIFIEKGKYDKAYDYLTQSLKINKERKDSYDIANSNNNLAKLYLKQKKYPEAKNHLAASIKLAKQVDGKDLLLEAYDFLYQIYSEENNHLKALESYKLYAEMNDSLYSNEANNRIAEMRIKYETENIESENELLRKDNEIHLLRLKRQEILQRYWIGFTILILILTILGFSQVRLKKRTNLLLESKNNQLKDANEKLSSSEKNLKELNATKDKFFSIIAHDLKNPFQALLGFSETLYTRNNELTDKEIQEYSKIIYESSQNLFNLLGNLLQWSKSQLGNIKVAPEKVILTEIYDEATSLLTLTADNKNIKLINQIPEGFTVFADKHIVSTVIRNLVSNAIKFTNQGGEITISSEFKGDEALISVSDNGIGIKPENLDKLFKIDYSYSTKGTDNEQGTGLGLILCKELIEENNGRIWCESTYGKGSNFYFTLPLAN